MAERTGADNMHAHFRCIWSALNDSIDSLSSIQSQDAPNAAWRKTPNHLKTVKKYKYSMPLRLLAMFDERQDKGPVLGEAIRCHLIHHCYSKSQKKGCNGGKFDLQLQLNAKKHGNKDVASSYTRNFLSPFPKSYPLCLSPEVKNMFTLFVNEVLRKPNNLSILDEKDIFGIRFNGPSAMQEFITHLETDESYEQAFLPPNRFYCSSAKRKMLAKEIVEHTFDPSKGPKIINIHAFGMRRGLSALGGYLTEHFQINPDTKFSKLRWLYVPVNSYVDQPSRLAQQEAPGFNVLMGRLHHFYCNQLDDIADAKPLLASESYAKALQDIREEMIKRPRVLILDGIHVYPDDDNISSIERMMTGENTLEIIAALLDPALCSVHTKEDLEEFAKNRIIILSNADMEPLACWDKLHPSVEIKSIPFVDPNPEEADALITANNFDNIDRIRLFREDNVKTIRDWSDSHYYALDALISFKQLDKSYNMEELQAELDEKSTRRSMLYALVVSCIDSIPPEYELLKKLMYLISAAPDGLRISTLQRLAYFSVESENPHNLITTNDIQAFATVQKIREGYTNSNVIKKATEYLLKNFPSFFRLSRDDYFYGVDSAPHPLELGVVGNLTTKVTQEEVLTVQFSAPEFRILVRDTLVNKGDLNTFHFCHRLLAEDALSQQTIGLRHGGFSEQQSVLHWRRQFAAIYHGLCSLPITFTDKEASIRDVDKEEVAQLNAITPRRPKEFWRWLYLFAYRRMIEQPPNYTMSRIHGEDALKRDLLVAFNRPWILWPNSVKALLPKNDESLSLFVGEYLPETGASDHNGLKIVRAYFFSLFQSNYVLGDLIKMHTILKKLCSNELKGPIPDINFEISVLKRKLDRSVLQLTAPNQLQPGGAGEWDILEHAFKRRAAAVEKISPENRDIANKDGLINQDNEDFDLKAYLAVEIPKAALKNMELIVQPSLTQNNPFNGKEHAKEIASQLIDKLQNVEGISSFADILFRIAELHAVHANNLEDSGTLHNTDIQNEPNTCPALDDISFPLLTTHKKKDMSLNDIILEFCKAHALFVIAEDMRLLAFKRDPLSGKFLASGHSTRTMIRVGLKMENYRRRVMSRDGLVDTGLGPFGKRARRDSDTLTRHLFRFPQERAAQLILEASKLRLMANWGSGRLDAFEAARKLLAKVEPIVMRMPGNSRRRLRLSLERNKLHRAMAKYYRKKDLTDHMQAMVSLCAVDITYMEAQSKTNSSCKIWKNISANQRKSFQKTMAEIKLHYPNLDFEV
jgi:hypothetical protein